MGSGVGGSKGLSDEGCAGESWCNIRLSSRIVGFKWIGADAMEQVSHTHVRSMWGSHGVIDPAGMTEGDTREVEDC